MKKTLISCPLTLIDLHSLPTLSRDASANRLPANISKAIGERLRELCQSRAIASRRIDPSLGPGVGSIDEVASGKTIVSIPRLVMIGLSLNLPIADLLKDASSKKEEGEAGSSVPVAPCIH